VNELMRELLALPPQASTFAKEVDQLHYFVISVTMIGAALTGIVALIFVARYRRKKEELTPPVVVAPWIEYTWIGGLLFLFGLWWLIGYQLFIRMQTPPPNSMHVYVTGKQWMWKFAYPNGQRAINVLTVPVNRPVRLTLSSRDVIHSFSIPAFRIKQDVVPGTQTTAWFEANRTGSFQILCAEYCGVSHSNMLARVDVLSLEEYEKWLDDRTPERESDDPLAVRGREIAAKQGCLACHTLDGRRHIGPTFAALYESEVTMSDGTKRIADPAYLTESMMDPRAHVVEGFPPVMPTYQGLLSAPEAGALVELIRSLRYVERGGAVP
jgi:cytochrome c oxidase subunit II